VFTLSRFLSRAASNAKPGLPRHRLKLSLGALEDRYVTTLTFVPYVVKE
jgi:hypothetical protein